MINKKSKRRSFFIVNKTHREILIVVFIAMLVPVALVEIALYFLIFNITAWQIGIPEAVFSILLPALKKVNFIVFITLPFVMFLLWLWALVVSKRIVGPFDRLQKELDKRIEGVKSGHLQVRKGDALEELIDKFNRLLDKSP